jgi:hypothetical protein
MKTRHCDECLHSKWDLTWDLSEPFVCAKGHTPRFYRPKDISDAMRGNWGWKRKCEDFVKEPEDEREEVERLRARKKHIYEDLKDAVERVYEEAGY